MCHVNVASIIDSIFADKPPTHRLSFAKHYNNQTTWKLLSMTLLSSMHINKRWLSSSSVSITIMDTSLVVYYARSYNEVMLKPIENLLVMST